MKISNFLIIAFVCIAFVDSTFAQRSFNNPTRFTAKSINNGKQIYKAKCINCHGLPTEGNNLTPDIPDLGATISISKKDDELYTVLTNGIGVMPGFKNELSDEIRWSLINYIRSFDPKMKGKIIGTLVFPTLRLEADADEQSRSVTVAVAEVKKTQNIPLSNLDIDFYVQRSFGRMALFDKPRKTNKQGKLTITVPKDIPGDEEGNIEIIARVTDASSYGEVEKSIKGKLAKTALTNNILEKRCLWGISEKIPIWLLCSYSGVMILIWVGIIYTIIKLIGIRKIS